MGDDWTPRRYDVDTRENVLLATGIYYLGSVDATDTWLYGSYRYRKPGVEWTHARTRTELADPKKENAWEIVPTPSKHAWAICNPRYPVIKSRYYDGDVAYGPKSMLFDLDGSNARP